MNLEELIYKPEELKKRIAKDSRVHTRKHGATNRLL